MRRFWGWLGLNLGRRAGTVALIGLLVTLSLGVGIAKVRFTTSNSDYLNTNDPAWIDNVNYENVFGGDPMAVMFTMNPGETVADLFTSQNQAEFESISDRLARDPWVFSAVTPLDAMQLSQTLLSSPDGIVLDSPAANILESAVRRDPSAHSKALRANYLVKEGALENSFPLSGQTLTNPKWVDFLIHEPWGSIRTAVSTFVPNNTHALLAIYLKGNLNINQESTAARSVLDILDTAHFQNASTITTGVPALLKTINDYLKHGITTLALIAAAIMVTILMLSFTVRWRLLAFAVVAVGLVWGFGLVGYFGIPLTLATIAALPVLLGVGMDYAIQMHSRIEEEVVLDRAAHPIQAAARGLGPALLVVTFDAVFAFLALWFAKTPAIREFGWLLVVGIIAVCVCSIIATLATLGIREYKSPTKGKDFSQSRMARLVVFLGSLPRKAALPLAGLSIVIFLGGIAVEGKLHIQTDPIQWVNPHAQSIIDIKALKAGTGSDNELAANIETTHPFSDQTVAYVSELSRQLQAKYPKDLWPAAGLINTVDQFVNSVPGTTHVPPTGAQIEGLYLLAPSGIRKTTVVDDGKAINVIFRGRTDLLSDLEPMVKYLQNDVRPPPGISVAPGGIAVVGVGLIQNLEKSRVLLTYLALLFVGGFLTLRLRSLVRALLSLVPVLVAVGAVSLVAVTFNLQLSPVTAVAGPLVVAVCTEFTSLILLRFVEERARGYSPREAMDATARRTGRAFLVSGMTAVAGIATLGVSSMPLLSEFGVIVALNVSVALLSALVVLPPVLVWAEQGNWVSRGLIRGTEPPYIEFEREEPEGPEEVEEPGAPRPRRARVLRSRRSWVGAPVTEAEAETGSETGAEAERVGAEYETVPAKLVEPIGVEDLFVSAPSTNGGDVFVRTPGPEHAPPEAEKPAEAVGLFMDESQPEEGFRIVAAGVSDASSSEELPSPVDAGELETVRETSTAAKPESPMLVFIDDAVIDDAAMEEKTLDREPAFAISGAPPGEPVFVGQAVTEASRSEPLFLSDAHLAGHAEGQTPLFWEMPPTGTLVTSPGRGTSTPPGSALRQMSARAVSQEPVSQEPVSQEPKPKPKPKKASRWGRRVRQP